MEKPLGFSDAVASGSIKRISSFFLFIWDLSLSHCYGLTESIISIDYIVGLRVHAAQSETLGDCVKILIFAS